MKEYQAPESVNEDVLAGIWRGLLKLPIVGRQDNFFELGGHSLLIVAMLEQLRQYGLTATVREIYANPTLESMARAVCRDAAVQSDLTRSSIPSSCDRIAPEMLPFARIGHDDIELITARIPGVLPTSQIYIRWRLCKRGSCFITCWARVRAMYTPVQCCFQSRHTIVWGID